MNRISHITQWESFENVMKSFFAFWNFDQKIAQAIKENTTYQSASLNYKRYKTRYFSS